MYLKFIVICPFILDGFGAYYGCFKNNDTHLPFHQTSDWSYMTNEMCQCNCLKAGKPYAGTQYFGKCSCGDNLPSNDYSLEERYCNSQCKGNSSQMCGGFERNSIYGTGLENL